MEKSKAWGISLIVLGLSAIISAIIVSKITGIPTVYTARDYMVICNLGLCLWKTSHRCHLPQYLSSDIPLYYKQYVGRVSLAKKVFLFIAQIRARFITRILYFWAQLADEIILTKADNPRAAKPGCLAKYFKDKKTHIARTVKEALGLALKKANAQDLVLVSGSLFVAGEARKILVR